jgi:hypothetical protein
MKILAMILLCLMIQTAGCSNSHNPSSALWQERQMDDDQRIHGNPYEMPQQRQRVWLPSLY